MSKVYCPECGKMQETIRNERFYCSGKKGESSVRHKKLQLMKERNK